MFMKKTTVLLAIMVTMFFTSFAQDKSNALGLRLGGGSMFGGEVSYQRYFSQKNRMELDLGFGGNSSYSAMAFSGIYQWVWNIDGGFNWYVGPGAGFAFNSGKDDHNDSFCIAIGGQIGIEYNFKIPLQLSLDTRPMFDFLADADGFGWGLSLGIRYKF